jgi:EpsI family protein
VGVAGLVLLFFGRAVFARSWAAIAYLLLAVPLWDGFTEPLHLRFQLLSASIGAWMLQVIGIPVFREGTFVELPTMRIEVARACSGVNYLIAVLALGLPLAYLYLRAWWRRVALVGAALLIAAFSNSLRVALIAVLVYYDLGAPLHGPAHVLHGLFVSGIGHVALFVGLWWLSRGERSAAAPDAVADAPPAPARWRPLPVLAGTVVAWAGAAFLYAYTPAPVRLAASLDHLPAQLGAWSADAFTSPTPPDWWTPADHELRRRYQANGTAVDLFVGYYEKQQQAREVVTYRANGLRNASRSADVPLAAADQPLQVNVARLRDGPAARLTVFWYEIDGRVETRPLPVKLRTLWNAIRHGRTNGAIICLTAPAGDAAADQATLASMTALAREVHAALGQCLPHRTPAPAGTAAALQPLEGGK